MNISSIYGTRPQPTSDLVASRRARLKDPPKAAPAAAARTTLPTENAGLLAAAISSAMAQLGLTAPSGQAAAGTAVGNAPIGPAGATPAPGHASKAITPGSRQVRQYQDVASTFSRLAQALDAGAGNTSSASGHASGLTTVFQSLWTSVDAASETSGALSGSPGIPNLQTFVQSLASHFGESGIPNLRGVFVDTVA